MREFLFLILIVIGVWLSYYSSTLRTDLDIARSEVTELGRQITDANLEAEALKVANGRLRERIEKRDKELHDAAAKLNETHADFASEKGSHSEEMEKAIAYIKKQRDYIAYLSAENKKLTAFISRAPGSGSDREAQTEESSVGQLNHSHGSCPYCGRTKRRKAGTVN